MPIVGITAKEIPHFKYVDGIEILSYENIKALFSNNEPFLNTRIIEFSEYVRKNVNMHKFIYLQMEHY